VAMVGDDVNTDVLAAQACGLTGVLVRTGKFRQDTLEMAGGRPDLVIDSIVNLPELLTRRGATRSSPNVHRTGGRSRPYSL